MAFYRACGCVHVLILVLTPDDGQTRFHIDPSSPSVYSLDDDPDGGRYDYEIMSKNF